MNLLKKVATSGCPTFSVKTDYGFQCYQSDPSIIKFPINLMVLATIDNLCLEVYNTVIF